MNINGSKQAIACSKRTLNFCQCSFIKKSDVMKMICESHLYQKRKERKGKESKEKESKEKRNERTDWKKRRGSNDLLSPLSLLLNHISLYKASHRDYYYNYI